MKFWEQHKLILDVQQVPLDFRWLIPLAERWGIHDVEGLHDDEVLDRLFEEATQSEIQKLVDLVEPYLDANSGQSDLYTWLAGSESQSRSPTKAYVAFTLMTLAFDEAKLRLSDNGNK